MKKRLQGFVCGVLCTLLLAGIGVFAANGWLNINVWYDDIKVKFNDVSLQLTDEPFICEGRTYLPVRAVSEALGLDVAWNQDEQTVLLSGNIGRHINYDQNDFKMQVLSLTNTYRAKNGLPALIWDEDFAAVAQMHCDDMQARGYFDHNTPEGKTPFQRMNDYGIIYMSAGENIAVGYPTPEAVMEGWIASDSHRQNILNPTFKYMGVGYNKEGRYWAQEFGSYWE